MLELKHGCTYINRKGKNVTVYERSWYRSATYSFTNSDRDITYTKNGLVQVGKETSEDLVEEYKEPDDIISKAALAEYIRNRLAVLETLSDSSNEKVSFAATMQMQELILLADEFEIV